MVSKLKPPEGAPVSCALCYYSSWSAANRPPHFTHNYRYEVALTDFAAIAGSAGNGCDGCKLLSHVWQLVVPETSEQRNSRLFFNWSGGHLWINIDILNKRLLLSIDVLTLYGEPSFKHVRVASLIPPSTSLEHNMSYIQTWLSSCQKMHAKCSEPSSYSPKRLLDVEIGTADVVKLVELSPTSQVQYACVSHCWGQIRSAHVTKSGNLASNMNAIPVSELPKTFRDAIHITRTLGLRYLWIDSLCIVQDSELDWSAHVDCMASIYESAFITLAAGASKDDEGGFFTAPQEPIVRPELLTLKLDGRFCNIYVRYNIDHPDARWPAKEILPLTKRGWCLQERLLSRRYLCFGTKEILWECMEDVACPCSIASGPFNPRDPGHLPSFNKCSAVKVQLVSALGDHRTLWRDMIADYSLRELTYARDMLPAFAGLADAFQRKFNPGTYHYGMWSSTLEQDLSWHVFGNTTSIGRPTRGPSWSWTQSAKNSLKVTFAKLYQDDNYQVQEIVEPNTGPHSLEFTALLVSGTTLTISLQAFEGSTKTENDFSLMRYCRVFEQEEQHVSDQKDEESSPIASYPVLPFSSVRPSWCDEKEVHGSSKPGQFGADYKFWSANEELSQKLQHLIFFILGVEIEGSSMNNNGSGFCWVAGMILRPSNRRSKGSSASGEVVEQFERIGWLRYRINMTRAEYTAGKTKKKTKFLIV